MYHTRRISDNKDEQMYDVLVIYCWNVFKEGGFFICSPFAAEINIFVEVCVNSVKSLAANTPKTKGTKEPSQYIDVALPV